MPKTAPTPTPTTRGNYVGLFVKAGTLALRIESDSLDEVIRRLETPSERPEGTDAIVLLNRRPRGKTLSLTGAGGNAASTRALAKVFPEKVEPVEIFVPLKF